MATTTLKETQSDVERDLPAPTVAKTMAVIEAVGRKAGGLTQAEVVQQTGCSANLVFRVLKTLETVGYVSRQDQSRRYVLTNRLMESCQPRSMDKSLVLCAYAAMRWLRDQSRETVQLVIRTGNKGLVLEQVSGLEPVQVMGRVGMRVPLYSCAPGKAILAALTEAELEEWLGATERKSFTENTKPDRTEQLREFMRHRDRTAAVNQLIDELLESPHFGERWARHWMDWIRYAESHGSEGDPGIKNAHLHRDYLIRALNDDIPYEQLVREHVAGDLLAEPRRNHELAINESLIWATRSISRLPR